VEWPGQEGRGVGRFVELSSRKMQGFMHFYCEKLLLATNWDQGLGTGEA